MWFAIVLLALVWLVVFGYAALVLAGDEDEASMRRWEREQAAWHRDDR